jgi:hypothetical protein
MPGTIRVGRPTRISHIPLSWDVSKARSNHEPKFRPVGDAILRGRERSVGQVMEEMFAAMPSPEPWITGRMTEGRYLVEAQRVAEPYVTRIAEILQVTFNEGALLGQDRIRASMNEQLRRLGSPLRLTDADGDVTKATADPQMVGGVRVGRSPKAVWAAVGVEAFDSVNTASVDYAKFRSGTLVTNMLEEQQRVIRDLIGESFTTQQTFRPVGDFPARTVTGLTAQQTSQALVEVLQEMTPDTSIARNLASFRGVNAAGLTHPWERAVYHRAESMATALGKQGVTGRAAYTKIQKDSQRYANKLRRSRARMISRTEIKRAQVHGQLSAMRQAVNDGLADPKTAGKKWVTGATDVCNVCSDLGFGKAIPLDQSFEGVGDGPPAHPNCRCDLDFAHTISEAPRAVGAGDPNYPAGTQQNPIVWQFPSGFQTQPSVTTTFKPPGFIPPPTIPVTQPPPSVPAPSAPPRGPQPVYDEPVVPAPPAKPAPAASTMETPQPAAFVDDLDGMMAAVADDAAAQGIRGPAQMSWESNAVTEVYGTGRIQGPQYYYDNRLKAGRRVQGFDKKPMRATHEELDDLVDRGGTNLFRGDEQAEFMDELLDGDYYPGQGMFGNGTYFDGMVAGESSAARVAGHLDTAVEYAGYTGPSGRVVRGVLKPNARTVSHTDIKTLQGEVRGLADDVNNLAKMLADEFDATGMIDDDTLQLVVEDVAALRRSAQRRRDARTGIVSEDAEKALDDLLEELLSVESWDDAYDLQSKAGYLSEMAQDEGTTAVLFGFDVIEADYGYRVVLNRDAVVFADSVLTADQARAAQQLWNAAIETTGDLSPTSAFQSVAGRSRDELGIGSPFG